DTSVHVRTRISILLGAGEVYQRAGRPSEAMQVLTGGVEQMKKETTLPEWALPAIDVERMSISARAGQDREQVARALDQVANMARRIAPTPTAVDVVVKAAGVLMGIGAVKLAESHFEAVVEGTTKIPEARAQRYQSLLGQAEAVKHIDGPEAAIEVQRKAIATVEPLGDSPM